MELVRAGFQDCVDDAAFEEALANVVRRFLGFELRDRIEWNGSAPRRQSVGIEPEAVGHRHSIDREAVEARVDAGEGYLPAGRLGTVEGCKRIARHEIADVAVDRRDLADLVGIENRRRALRNVAGAFDPRSSNDDFLSRGLERQRQFEGLSDCRVDVGYLRRSIATC